MGCPRCGGSLEEFSLGDSRSTTCEACGWVGIDVDLGPRNSSEPDADWEDATVSDGPQSRKPDIVTPEPRSETGEGTIPHDTRTLLGLEAAEAERLEAAGIRSLDALAAAEPAALADELDIAAHRIRPWVRRASILLVTDGAE